MTSSGRTWVDIYDVGYAGGSFLARRILGGDLLAARTPAGLDSAIRADFVRYWNPRYERPDGRAAHWSATRLAAVPRRDAFAEAHDGVPISTPNGTPTRACAVRRGEVPGEERCTSGFLVSRPGIPGGAVRMLEKLFADGARG